MNDIITKDDIIAHAIYPAIAGEFDSATEEAIEEAIFEVAPRGTWTYTPGEGYSSPAMDYDTFWAIVERVATA
jgi:hypothetical protein